MGVFKYKEEFKQSAVLMVCKKGNPYDNAMAKNFISCMKCEWLHLMHFHNHTEAKLAVFEFIEGFYNKRRRHVKQALFDSAADLCYDSHVDGSQRRPMLTL